MLPERIGRYEICAEVASGGMATVYLARLVGPAGFDKLVALKCVHAHLAKDRQFIEMFLDEARLVSRIRHPRVCSVFDVGFVDGQYYLAMDFLEGVSVAQLCQRLTEGGLPVAQRCLLASRLTAQASEGLHAAHELLDETSQPLQVVHRDVSPQNLFVTWDGNLQVVDFGVAHATGRMHQTLSSALKGKLAYMSPEQLNDEHVDRRTDVWALGVVLWETLTLRRLFRKRTEPGTMHAVLEGPIPAPSSVSPGVPPELDRVVLRALERDVDKRYPTARALAKDLNRFASSWGVPMGESEIAELLEELMPIERQHSQQLVSGVRDRPRADLTPASPTLPGKPRSPVLIALLTGMLGAGLVFGVWMLQSGNEASEQPVATSSPPTVDADLDASASTAVIDASPVDEVDAEAETESEPETLETTEMMVAAMRGPQRIGELSVFTPNRPPLHVRIRGRDYGETPVTMIRLRVGRHRVELLENGRVVERRQVDVTLRGSRLIVR